MANGNFIENLLGDLKHAARVLWRSPAFAATAIAALALGIGANTAIFSVVNAVLLQPLSYPQPDRLVALERHFPEGDGSSVSIPKFTVWSEQTQVFQAVTAYDFAGPGMNLTGGDRPEQIKGIHASSGYFEVFGAPLAIGRTYTPEEDRPGAVHVAVISNGLWRSRFAGDPAVIGKTIELTGDPYEIIGVLGPTFQNRSACGYLVAAAGRPEHHQSRTLFVVRRAPASRRYPGAGQRGHEIGRRENSAENFPARSWTKLKAPSRFRCGIWWSATRALRC